MQELQGQEIISVPVHVNLLRPLENQRCTIMVLRFDLHTQLWNSEQKISFWVSSFHLFFFLLTHDGCSSDFFFAKSLTSRRFFSSLLAAGLMREQ